MFDWIFHIVIYLYCKDRVFSTCFVKFAKVEFCFMLDTHVVIMAGGIGSRFWPLSTPEYPKQFIDVLGVGRTMIQMTVDRFSPMCPVENI